MDGQTTRVTCYVLSTCSSSTDTLNIKQLRKAKYLLSRTHVSFTTAYYTTSSLDPKRGMVQVQLMRALPVVAAFVSMQSFVAAATTAGSSNAYAAWTSSRNAACRVGGLAFQIPSRAAGRSQQQQQVGGVSRKLLSIFYPSKPMFFHDSCTRTRDSSQEPSLPGRRRGVVYGSPQPNHDDASIQAWRNTKDNAINHDDMPREEEIEVSVMETSSKTMETGLLLTQQSGNTHLSLPAIAEMVDQTFLQACLQLAEGYVDTLKLFIVAVQSAYVQRIPIQPLITAVNTVREPAARRPLLPDEIRLRDTWIQVIYIMLRAIQYPTTLSSANVTTTTAAAATDTTTSSIHDFATILDSNVEQTYMPIVPVLIRRRALKNEFRGKELFDSTKQFFSTNQWADPMVEHAIALQTLRVMWFTLAVVEDIELCEVDFARMDAKL